MTMELKKCEICGAEKKNLGVHMIKHRTKSATVPEGSLPPDDENHTDGHSVDKMDSVIKGLNSVAAAVNKLIEMQTATPSVNKYSVSSEEKKFTPTIEDETYPSNYVPPRFRKIVDETLSNEFGINVVDFEDRTDFQVNITVPEKFSSISTPDKEKGVKDIRSRLIPRALGENGVKEWCMLIRKNLNRFYQREGVQSPFNTQA